MRPSAVRLAETPVRLSDLTFPSQRDLIHRTRLAFIHLDNLLHFAKIDRDGRVDGYLAAYLPDEVVLVFFRQGEPLTAVAFQQAGRQVLPLSRALKAMRHEVERGELAYCDAPFEQLCWMYQSCAVPAASRSLDPQHPELVFVALKEEGFTGVLELISNGRVSYIRLENGQFVGGYFCGHPDSTSVGKHVEGLFHPNPDGSRPAVAASVFPAATVLPQQAPVAMVETYRELFWRVADAAEREVPGEARARGLKVRDAMAQSHAALNAISVAADSPLPEVVATPEQLTAALASWTLEVLQQLEVIAPGVGPAIIREATKEQRFVLQKAGFYQTLPWTIDW